MHKRKNYDVAIIGSGISGLTSAALLSRLGLSVVVLEKHSIPGGYLQGFERKGFIFDSAIHWLNQCGPGGTVSMVFSFLGKDYPKAQEMKVIQRHLGKRHDYVLTNNPDKLREQLKKDFPHESDGIDRFFNEAKKIARISLRFKELFRSPETLSGLAKKRYLLNRIRISFPLFRHALYAGDEGIRKGLSRYFKDKELQKLFCSERDFLSCIFPIAWAYNHDYQNPPIGGSQAFPAWLIKQLPETAELLLSCDVTGIKTDGKKATSLLYSNRAKEYELSATHIIAACDTEILYHKLFPESAVSASLKEKLRNAELYPSSVTVSIALDCPVEQLGFSSALTVLVDEDQPRDEQTSGNPDHSAISVLAPTSRDHLLAPEGCGTLTLYVASWMHYENEWKTTTSAAGKKQRNEAYKQLKNDVANVLINRVAEKLAPGLREHILFYEVATPVTYERYSSNKNGSMMGTRPGKTNFRLKVAHYKTPLENVIVGGQWAELGGGVPIAVKAAYNASLIVLKEQNRKDEAKKLLQIFEA